MPDNPVNNANQSTVVELFVELDRRMREGFSALTQGQDSLRKDQEAMRNEQQALSKRMEDGFAAAAQERQALSKRMEEGFTDAAQERRVLSRRIEDGLATEAGERRTLAHKLDDLRNWLVKEIPETGDILFKHILADREKFEHFVQEMLKFQSDFQKFKSDTQKFQSDFQEYKKDSLLFQNVVNETLEHIRRVLERNEQRSFTLEEVVERLREEFAEFKNEKSIHDQEVQQRLSRLEAAQNLNR